MALVALAYQPIWQSDGEPMLEPGDRIGGMIITTGVASAAPLWAFCRPGPENDGVVTADCHVPALSRLAIGHPFDWADPTLQALDWSALSWEMYLDGQLVNLEAFGIYHYAKPDLARPPSPFREVFRQMKVWNVVLVNPTSGRHTLHGSARAGGGAYTWAVNFTIEAPLE